MHAKGPVTEKPYSYSSEVVHIVRTVTGEDRLITERNYDEIKLHITKGEMYGAIVANEDTDQELVIPLKHVESIRKERREQHEHQRS